MEFLTAKQIRPAGWLKRQLEIQAAGLSGNLDKIWPDVKFSRWIGGDREGWERVPYWLDGFVPLAYLLDDEDMKARAQKYIDAILAGQRADGWLCPCDEECRSDYDLWALFLILKVLIVYYDCSGDERVENAVYRALKNLYCFTKANTLKNWGSARWFECIISISWMYERKREDWLKDLAVRLRAQGIHYDHAAELWKGEKAGWSYETHVVNAAMALKGEALYRAFMGEKNSEQAEYLYGILKEYHSTAYGHFVGDECLGEDSPIRGTELCGVVEAMYSYEWLFKLTGDAKWGELLESLAFNALPAAVSEDMWAHQYDQMTNQIACVSFPEKAVFGTNGNEANRFGLEPNYGCCTANFGQGFTKFCLSAIMKHEGGYTVLSGVPFLVKDGTVEIECVTEYPFRRGVKYKINNNGNAEFELKIRIPERAGYSVKRGLMCDIGGFLVFEVPVGISEAEVEYTFCPELLPRPRDMYALSYGPLVFALPVKGRAVIREYETAGTVRKYPYCDYDIYPEESWGYAFTGGEFKVVELPYSDAFSRSDPPLRIFAEMAPVEWGEEDGHPLVAARANNGGICGKKVVKAFQPYGSTTLRMAEMPLIISSE